MKRKFVHWKSIIKLKHYLRLGVSREDFGIQTYAITLKYNKKNSLKRGLCESSPVLKIDPQCEYFKYWDESCRVDGRTHFWLWESTLICKNLSFSTYSTDIIIFQRSNTVTHIPYMMENFSTNVLSEHLLSWHTYTISSCSHLFHSHIMLSIQMNYLCTYFPQSSQRETCCMYLTFVWWIVSVILTTF